MNKNLNRISLTFLCPPPPLSISRGAPELIQNFENLNLKVIFILSRSLTSKIFGLVNDCLVILVNNLSKSLMMVKKGHNRVKTK